ncbi:MAG: hypothetical protein AAGA18_09555 [Verrucomicrobiota bacterium]
MEQDQLYRIYEPTDAVDPQKPLPAFHWYFLSRIDGVSTCLEIGQELDYSEPAVYSAIEGLLAAGAIKERLWTFHEFFPAAESEPSSTLSMKGNKKYLLKDVIDFITSRSPSDMEGKLVVYRVFLQIPPEFLEEEGITSFDFSESELEIKSNKLKDAISQATSNILGVPYNWNK